MVKIIVDGQSLRWYDRTPKIAADSIEFVKFKFLLSEEWDDHVVVAQFSQKGATYNKVLEDGCCTLPVEIEDGKCFISVFGQIPGGSSRATVIPLLTDVFPSGFVRTASNPIPPTPDLYSQLIDYFLRHSSGGAGAVDPEDIAQAVEDYLTRHPVEGSYSTTTEITDESTDKEVPTAAAVREYVEQHSGGNTGFKTDSTLKLEDGILSVNTTDKMEQDNTLPMTSAGVYATVGNIEALLKTI